MATLLEGTTFNSVRVCQRCSFTNTIVGFEAGQCLSTTTYRNTIFGYQAAKFSVSSCDNSVMGFRALNGTGVNGISNNCRTVSFGSYAMADAENNNDNVAVGFKVMKSLQIGSNGNTSLGSYAGYGLQYGTCNVFVGYKAASSAIGADCNIAIGYCAMTALDSGDRNIGIGNCALSNVDNGLGNIGIGYRTGTNVTTACNTISIGYDVTTGNNNGHTAVGGPTVMTFCSATSWTNLSDRRDKTDINTLNENLGLNFIRSLRPVKFNFDFREAYVKKCGFEYGIKDGTLTQPIESYGFIAQEIEQTMNNLNVEFESLNYEQDGDNYRLIYEGLISPIVKSLQQTINRLETLEDKVK